MARKSLQLVRVPAALSEIESLIVSIRGSKALLDHDLARLYGVTTKALKQAVRRNARRFPPDFMTRLSLRETRSLLRSRSQIVTLNRGTNAKYAAYAFTEQGVAMLSSVLRSQRAIHVNIAVMRAFVYLRRLLETHQQLARRLNELERKYDGKFAMVFDAIRRLMSDVASDAIRPRIGFRVESTGRTGDRQRAVKPLR